MHNPLYMFKRLQIIAGDSKRYQPPERLGPLIEEIYKTPARKKIYQLIIKEFGKREGEDTVVFSNGNEGNGIIIQCQYTERMELHQNNDGIQKVIAAKKLNITKYQKDFDAFVITNGIGFAKSAVTFAKRNNVQLISRNNLIEFISQVKVPAVE